MPRTMLKTSDITKFWTAVLHLGVILAALYVTSFYSYVLFHTLAEIVSVVIAVAIFLVAWNSRRFWDNNYYILIGFGFLFVGVIDLFHAFEYKGVGILQQGGNSNIATQLWLAGRYLLALTFLVAPFLSRKKLKTNIIFTVFAIVTVVLFMSIFRWNFFPAAYVDGSGLTVFKKISEYALILFFLAAFAFFYGMRTEFHGRVFRLISLVMLLMALTEFSFTLYVGVYDFFNLFGHMLKIVAYYIAYLAIVEFGLMKPYNSIFKELKDKEVSLKRATREWDLMFNSITDPAFILDTDHTVTFVNKALCEFMNDKKENLVGRKCFEFMHKQSSPWETCPMKATCQSRKPHTEEIFDPAIGKVLSVTTSPILDENGGVIGILHIAKDITEQKDIERAKDEFISLASHQLRTPLSSISLASELLLRGAVGKNDPEQKELLDEIYQSTKRMSALIEHMLNVSRVELGTMLIKPQPLEADGCINEIADELASQIKNKNLTLHKVFEAQLPSIRFDNNILRIITENLLTNAIRYTPVGGTITLSLARKDDGILFSVCDTGCGIPKDEQGNIFKKAFRASNAKQTSADGHGLGLYMTKAVLDKAGAKIRFVSEEGKGTTFFVTLPISENN